MSDIFVSYASEDRERVRPLVERLESEGWSVWWDRAIPAGRTWPQMIEGALADCRVAVVIWTEASIESEWVLIEASEARKAGKLVPVRLDDVEVPLEFRRIQAADLTDWDGDPQAGAAQALISGIRAFLDGQGSASADTGVGADPAVDKVEQSPSSAGETPAESSAIYNAVTKHWPKIALGSIGAAVGAGFAFGRIAGVSFQSYVFAWAATTGGIWFLLDKAETAMSARSKKRTIEWLRGTDTEWGIEGIPAGFAMFFDEIFGRRHLSLTCFARSSLASFASLILVYGLAITFRLDVAVGSLWSWRSMQMLFVAGAVMNLVPDYLSLMETRWLIGRSGRVGLLKLPLVLMADFVATTAIFFLWTVGIGVWFSWYLGGALGGSGPEERALSLGSSLGSLLRSIGVDGAALPTLLATTYFTSVWLWLYAASVILSRVLLRMNSGVGFLLRVTDVERQPFRSMGFVSVIIVSVLFALGLPLVLL